MRARVVRRINEAIIRQREAIIAGDYPDPEVIERIGPMLKKLSERELAPISEALSRNLELLGIARDAVAEMRAPPSATGLRTYTAQGNLRPPTEAAEVLIKR
ncbi:hypothetical protein [Pontivivens nitratireducens]|uniref:hypothetical protein n=1 Tax=Pontivivens nitratireducens TaxID=2758038 RepID=UPI001C8D818F|nr:hypothetical protein [Pontibrevibacter nitratireducens]